MKRVLVRILLIPVLILNLTFGGGIPTFDGVNMAQSLVQYIEQVDQWAQQAQRWSATANYYNQQIASMTGVRDVTSFLKEVKSVYELAKKQGIDLDGSNEKYIDENGDIKTNLEHNKRKIFEELYRYDYCKDFISIEQKSNCNLEKLNKVDEILINTQYAEAMKAHSENLKKFKTKLEKSKDIKESSDTMASIQSELTLLQITRAEYEDVGKKFEKKAYEVEIRENEYFIRRERNFIKF